MSPLITLRRPISFLKICEKLCYISYSRSCLLASQYNLLCSLSYCRFGHLRKNAIHREQITTVCPKCAAASRLAPHTKQASHASFLQENLNLLSKHQPSNSNVDIIDSNKFFQSIRKVLDNKSSLLRDISHYHFNGLGKSIRPTIILLAAKAFNSDSGSEEGVLLQEQTVVAMVAEMIHTASLVHDDIIDGSLTRRGNPSVFSTWGQSKAVYAGDNILAKASMALAKLNHNEVMRIMSEILENLVQGEFMQLGTKEYEDERFNHYIEKSYRKTASLIANSCKAAVLLGGCSKERVHQAFEYGKSVGIAFQLVDDLLDFISNDQLMGKPTAADLKLGLATAPVLFAAHEFPELNSLILRRFSADGDVQKALDIVNKSSGVDQTKDLAARYGHKAVQIIQKLKPSAASDALEQLVIDLLYRTR